MSDVCGLLRSCGMIAIFGCPLHHHKIDSCDHLVLVMILTVIFPPIHRWMIPVLSMWIWSTAFPVTRQMQEIWDCTLDDYKVDPVLNQILCHVCEILFCHVTSEIFGLPVHHQKINNYDLVQMSDFCHVSSLHQQMPDIYKLPLSLLDALDWYLSTFLGTQGISVAFNSQIILWTCIPHHQMVFLEWVLGLD